MRVAIYGRAVFVFHLDSFVKPKNFSSNFSSSQMLGMFQKLEGLRVFQIHGRDSLQ